MMGELKIGGIYLIQNLTEGEKRYCTEENLERLRKMRPIDDDFMRALFHDNIELVQQVLRIILSKDDLVVTEIKTQEDMKRITGARSICLDAYATDSMGKKYDIEIQRSSEGAGPHRARYHSSVMDVENLKAGQAFDELPDTYVIFITENDYFGEKKPVYVYRYEETETHRLLGDGTTIIYVNGEYTGDDLMGDLMHDFRSSDPKEMHIGILSETARYFKESEKGVSTMCKSMEELRDQSIALGIEKGKMESFCNLIRKGYITVSQAAETMEITEEEFQSKLYEAGFSLS